MNALTKPESTALALPESELLQVLQSSLYPGGAIPSIKMVLGYCKAAGLDPMQKPVHIVPMWDSKAGAMRDVVMPGVNLYRTQAARSGQLAGMSEPEFGPMHTDDIGGQKITYPEWCRVTVERALDSGIVAKFTAVEYWLENYAVKGGKEKSIAPNAMWTKRPRGQLAKCTEAQALRKAFPEIAGPATADEMEGKVIHQAEDAQIVEAAPPPLPAAWPAEAFERQFARWKKAIEQNLKSHDEIVALARSVGELSVAQVDQIRSVRIPPKTDEAAPAGDEYAPPLTRATTQGEQQ